ncbi:ABC transporter ATP-binding protein [Halobaculum sp. MBLA0143]|uniref:ABC transporter ATP-binding protein n=1 Tax=Halobaculum sp. MBLA0143 TaxID=3079933 RepID=UPI003525239F
MGFRRYLRGRKLLFGGAAVSTVLWRLANIVPPYLLGRAVDAFFTGERSKLSVAFVPQAWIPESLAGQFGALVASFGGLVAFQVACNVARHLSWRWLQQSVLHDLRTDVYDAVQRLDVATLRAESTGDVMSVVNNDVNRLQTFLDDGAQTLFQVSAFFVVLLAAMLGIHAELTLLVVGFVPVMLAAVYGYQRLVEPRYDDRRTAVGRLNTHVETVLGSIETVKAFTNESFERERLRDRSLAFWRADWRAAKLSGVFFPARQFVSLGVMLAIVVVGGWWAIAGPPLVFSTPLSPGEFVTFYFFGQMFVGQSARLSDVADTYTDAKASAKRVFGLLAYPTAESTGGAYERAEPWTADGGSTTDEDGATGERPTTVDGTVAFEDVTFSYPGESQPALEGVDFTASAGEYVGLVGPTGAGKSTVLRLLFRFYRPDEGTIRVDGTDVAELSTDRLREAVGYVGQESTLLDGTVRENIAYGDHDATDAEIRSAAERANAHGFVTDLDDGYDTEVGERGVKLSGGQRQRIAIARAIVRDPEILLLDEATSHVDNRTELYIQEGLAELIEGRTTVAVAHRLSTIRDADTILVFEDGQIRERGAHETLLAAGGLYADLWRLHTGEASELSELALSRGE